MDELLRSWDNFFEIAGSAAATLTGLTFIVITLSGQVRRVNPHGLRAFITPTIVHFSVVLALAALSSMPSHTLRGLAFAYGAAAGLGLVYVGSVAWNIRCFVSEYVPVYADWLWNVVLPGVAYGILLVAASCIWQAAPWTMYAAGSVLILLLLIGIHNAWDIAVWHIQRLVD